MSAFNYSAYGIEPDQWTSRPCACMATASPTLGYYTIDSTIAVLKVRPKTVYIVHALDFTTNCRENVFANSLMGAATAMLRDANRNPLTDSPFYFVTHGSVEPQLCMGNRSRPFAIGAGDDGWLHVQVACRVAQTPEMSADNVGVLKALVRLSVYSVEWQKWSDRWSR